MHNYDKINTTGKSVKTCRALLAKIFRLPRRANQLHNSARLTQLRGARDRHERAVRCDGRGRRARRSRRMRTAKSCGPDAAVLASSCGGFFFCATTVAKEPFTGESSL